MIYNLRIDADDVLKIGAALDKQPHGEVSKLIKKIQAQIDAQEKEHAEAMANHREQQLELWRNEERGKIRAELTPQIKAELEAEAKKPETPADAPSDAQDQAVPAQTPPADDGDV